MSCNSDRPWAFKLFFVLLLIELIVFIVWTAPVWAFQWEPYDVEPYVMVEEDTRLGAAAGYEFRSVLGCYLAGQQAAHQPNTNAYCYENKESAEAWHPALSWPSRRGEERLGGVN